MLALVSSFPNLSSGKQRKSLLISFNAGGKLERAQSSLGLEVWVQTKENEGP